VMLGTFTTKPSLKIEQFEVGQFAPLTPVTD
jgi:hypothetical protein